MGSLNACAATLLIMCAPVWAAASKAAEASSTDELIEAWVVLSEPALATLPADATEQRSALRERIVRQQDQVMAQLSVLGAIESGRIQQTSNALAVTLPRAALQSVKKIDGVSSVRPVNHGHQIHDSQREATGSPSKPRLR